MFPQSVDLQHFKLCHNCFRGDLLIEPKQSSLLMCSTHLRYDFVLQNLLQSRAEKPWLNLDVFCQVEVKEHVAAGSPPPGVLPAYTASGRGKQVAT